MLLTVLLSCGRLPEESTVDTCDGPPWPASAMPGQIMIADTGGGKIVLVDRIGGEQESSLCLSSLLPDDCATLREDGAASCQVFGITADNHGLLVSFSNTSPTRAVSGVMHYDTLSEEMSWRIDGLRFPLDHALRETCLTMGNQEPLCRLRMPHAANWSPDGELVIADTLNDRVLLLRPPDTGTGVADVIATLDSSEKDWGAARWPNHVQVLSRNHEVYLLVTYKGSDPSETGNNHAGRIMLWEVTDPASPRRVWAYPEEGYLAAVHHAVIQEGAPDGEQLMLYAHSFGSSDAFEGETGSIGMALATLDSPPVYLGDGLTSTDEALGFVRSADLIDNGNTLLVTDSGCEHPNDSCSRIPRVLELSFTLPEPAGISGAFSPDHSAQRFIDLPMLGHSLGSGLQYPFESELVPQPQSRFRP
ncbi:MAG: hypothetical protein P8R54_01700 [Myxococcota bacterium]|nr:hypothetical protein [Myxococcota bacterium]